jgi:hypothetical protein
MGTGKNFEYLGSVFQLQLLNQIIIDKEFGRSIIDVIESDYFENKYETSKTQKVPARRYHHGQRFRLDNAQSGGGHLRRVRCRV